MVIVFPKGALFDYTVAGKKEDEAAKELDSALECNSR